jgi:hypothetical protein
LRAKRWRRRPTRICTKMKIGIRISVMMVSCQDRMIIETRAALTVTTLDRIDVAVLVSTVRTPLTSLASRDWMAPVLVAVNHRAPFAGLMGGRTFPYRDMWSEHHPSGERSLRTRR